MTEDRYYAGIRVLRKVFTIEEANKLLEDPSWELLRLGQSHGWEIPGPGAPPVSTSKDEYTLGRRESSAPLPDLITQGQLDYVNALSKRSAANADSIKTFLKGRSLNAITKLEASELIEMLLP